MAKGNKIIVTANPKGNRLSVVIDGTPKPGTIMTIKPGSSFVQGRPEYEAAGTSTGLMSADGDRIPIAVLDMDQKGGRPNDEAYVDGEVAEVYFPLPGDELNVLKLDVAGTGDDFAVGDKLIVDDGTGKVLITAGSPESEPFLSLEVVTDPTADQLVHCQYTGY